MAADSEAEVVLRNCPLGLAAMAQSVVSGAPEMAQWLAMLPEGTARAQFTTPVDDDAWLGMYRHQGRMLEWLAELLCPEGIGGQPTSQFLREARRGIAWLRSLDANELTEFVRALEQEWRAISPEDLAEFQATVTDFRKTLLACEPDSSLPLAGDDLAQDAERKHRALASAEFQFFLLV